jgi:hypothetical protein
MSGGSVALNKSVCSVLGRKPRISVICGRKPMDSISSLSSKMNVRMPAGSSVPRRK